MFRHSFDILKGIRFRKTAAKAIAVVAAVSMCACSDSEIINAPEVEPDNVSVSISFSISMDKAHSTRAVDPNEETTPGTPRENAINSAIVIIEDATTGERTPIVVQGLKEGVNTVKVEEVKPGDKRIYVGANLSDEQIAAFCESNRTYEIPASLNDRKFDMVEAYAPGFSASTRSDIAMFCDNILECKFEPGKTRYDLGTVYLKRLVAKILVTCDAENGTDEAKVIFKAGSVLANDGGWMYRKDVYFIVNGINRKSYIMQEPDGDTGYYLDPNYSLAGNIGTLNGQTVPVKTDDFYYNDDPKFYDITASYMQTPLYEEVKIPTTEKNGNGVYTEGIYAPENTFSVAGLSTAQMAELANYKKAWPMITHVTITSKYTPKSIYVEESVIDYIQESSTDLIDDNTKTRIRELFVSSPRHPSNRNIRRLTFINEKDAITVLNFSLRNAGYHVTGAVPSAAGLPDDTYYALSQNNTMQFYTYGAAKLLTVGANGANRIELGDGYSPYIGGRGYYSAYIDNRKDYDTSKTGYESFRYGSVERNVYYILIIDNFSSPGSSNTESEVIEVHTQTIGWEMGGSGNITLQ